MRILAYRVTNTKYATLEFQHDDVSQSQNLQKFVSSRHQKQGRGKQTIEEGRGRV